MCTKKDNPDLFCILNVINAEEMAIETIVDKTLINLKSNKPIGERYKYNLSKLKLNLTYQFYIL